MLENGDRIGRPQNRDKALSVAYLRLLGGSQAEVASAVGCHASTVLRWEQCEWWAEVRREAAARWLEGLTARARRGLETAVTTDGRLALQVLERLVPELAAPRLTVGISADTTYEEMTDGQLQRIASGETPFGVLARG